MKKIKININSNFEWNIESDKDWVNFSKTHGYNNDSVFITINPATDTIITNANIKITSSNLSCDFNIIRDYIHPVYNIGDCYPNTTSPIGVVFDVSEDGKKGKIVAICKENLYSRYSTWYEYVGANEYLDGEDNMKKVIENSSLYEYPAMRYCSKYKDGSWYLPAYLEINIMNARRDVVNAKLKELNAEIINGYYISSTEHGLTQFMTGGYESGTYQIRYFDKKVSMNFVPIRKF